MSITEYENAMEQYGEIISSKQDDVGYEIRFTNNSGTIEIFQGLYNQYLKPDFTLTRDDEEPNYYKAYFLRKI
jgi:hypothetical protein